MLIPTSQGLVWSTFLKNFVMLSRKPEDLNFRPNKLGSCVAAIITEVAEVNPTVTGTEMKSMRTPKFQWKQF